MGYDESESQLGSSRLQQSLNKHLLVFPRLGRMHILFRCSGNSSGAGTGMLLAGGGAGESGENVTRIPSFSSRPTSPSANSENGLLR
jgi:hypothetical protein